MPLSFFCVGILRAIIAESTNWNLSHCLEFVEIKRTTTQSVVGAGMTARKPIITQQPIKAENTLYAYIRQIVTDRFSGGHARPYIL